MHVGSATRPSNAGSAGRAIARRIKASPIRFATVKASPSTWAGYVVAMRKARLDGLHAAAIAAVGSLTAYVPVYAAIFGTSLFDAPWHDLALQAFVHGLLVAVISFLCIGRAVGILGASNGSAFAALGPAITAILAIPILGEWPATRDWIAMLLISVGVYIASGARLPARRLGHVSPN